MIPMLLNCADELVKITNRLHDQGKPLNAKDIFARYAIDVIGTTSFGIECNSLKNPETEFLKYGRKVFEVDWYQGLVHATSAICPSILTLLKIPIVRPQISKFYTELVKETVEFREKNGVIRNDLLQLLIQLKNNSDISSGSEKLHKSNGSFDSEDLNQFTLRDLTAQAYIFLVAGFETTSSTLAYCFHELSCNTKIQRLAREEVVHVLGMYSGKICDVALKNMTYLDKIIQGKT